MTDHFRVFHILPLWLMDTLHWPFLFKYTPISVHISGLAPITDRQFTTYWTRSEFGCLKVPWVPIFWTLFFILNSSGTVGPKLHRPLEIFSPVFTAFCKKKNNSDFCFIFKLILCRTFHVFGRRQKQSPFPTGQKKWFKPANSWHFGGKGSPTRVN